LLAINWGVFVWAAQHGRIIDCSLGYFINPLLNVLIGSRLLGEHLSRLQKLSIGSAACGVLTQLVLVGRFPWIGLLPRLAVLGPRVEHTKAGTALVPFPKE